MMLRLGREDARRLIGGAAYTYKNDIAGTKVTAPLTAFADVHGAPVQRFYNLLCIAYGADPQTFGDLVDQLARKRWSDHDLKRRCKESGIHETMADKRDDGQLRRDYAYGDFDAKRTFRPSNVGV
jgi:Putative metallopeptidase